MSTDTREERLARRIAVGPDKCIPLISAPIIVNYITDLQLIGLL